MEMQNVEVGQKIAWFYGRSEERIIKIDRLTDTQIVCKYADQDIRFWKKNGREVGYHDSWSSSFVVPLTEELKNSITTKNKKLQIRRLMESIKLPDSIEQLDEIISVLSKHKTVKP